MDILSTIYSRLPYGPGFCFVDRYERIDEQSVEGYCRYDPDAHFYRDHFPDNPITPGVILIETMAQIGLVGLGMFLVKAHEVIPDVQFVFTESNVQFLEAVYPGETVKVISEKVYFRLGKLKCTVNMFNEKEEKVCTGTLAGIMIDKKALK